VPGDAVHAGVPIHAGDTSTIPPTDIPDAESLANAPTDAGAAASETRAQHRRVVKSATIISLGTLLGSVMGFVRSETINVLFYGDASGAFTLALRPIQQVSDLLVGGSVSGALIPTFVDYSEADKREELRRIYSTVANLVALVMLVACVGVVIAAPFFIPLETRKFSPAAQQLTVRLVQLAAFSLLGLGLYLVGSALLYAMKEVVYPAFAPVLYHAGVIVFGVLILLFALHNAGVPLSAAVHGTGPHSDAVGVARFTGAKGLAIGAAVGAFGEFLLLVPALRRILGHWRPVLDLRHPAVRHIMRLYAPLATGLIVSVVVQNIDVALTGLTPGGAPENATSIASAVLLIQFPVGLVSSALSLAVFPLLVPAATAGDMVSFKRTLRLGFRLGLLLMLPATIGLLVLATPIMALLFQHGLCGSGCTYRNVLALQTMAGQLPFLVLDQLLIFAYYARKNTVVPTVVGVIGAGIFVLVAAPLAPRIGLPGITWANAIQNSSHAVILFVLLTLAIGDLGMRNLVSGGGRILLAGAGMAAVCVAALRLLPRLSPHTFANTSSVGALLLLVVSGGLGLVVYFGLVAALRVEELRTLGGVLRARLRGQRS
jgi:putative peptidoglycan lipid II flippase